MSVPEHVFRAYDIRGDADRELHDALVHDLGRAFATALLAGEEAPPPRVAVARDCRHSSARLFAALTSGLVRAGAEVVDVGVGPTPLLYFAAHHLQTEGAVMVTGSHNPPADNGFKMMRGLATLYGDAIASLRDRIATGALTDRAGGSLSEDRSVSAAYLDNVIASIEVDRAAAAAIHVVVDAGNGAAGPLGVQALRALGFRVEPLFCEMDGDFPNHHPDPTVEENLVALRDRVRERGADLGVAWDGDGDRLGVVDDRGDVVWGDRLLILLSRALLATHPGATVLAEVKCSQILLDDIRAHGGRAVLCATGHSLIKKRMREEGALLAGEMSGHVFFADRYPGFDDGIYAAARLLELLASGPGNLRERLADVPQMASTPELRLPCGDAVKLGVVEAVRTHFQQAGHDVNDLDGARIDFGDGAWGLCRASNTGAVLVLRFEAPTPARVDAIRAEVEAVVARARARLEP